MAFQLQINAGGNAYTDGNGNIWNADQAYLPGSWGYVNIDTSKTWSTTADIANTDNDPLYQTERWGNFSYLFDLPNGNYTVSLDFTELYWHAPGKRIFDVRIEGTTVIDDWDMYADIGYRTATSKVFMVNVTDGQLNIDFQASVDSAKVSAIKITGVHGAMAKRLAKNGGVMSAVPNDYGLSANYPNPFNPSTTIDYQLPEAANVKMVIYDLLGRQIRTLVDRNEEAGYHAISWDSRNENGMQVPAGIYILKLHANKYTAIRKMVLMK
ncbi:flagellar basal body rod modification protein [bacterium BMS3Abin05]|nr:flagellar basal body rod modification protein [bacterium BMS3Abin05]